jgi:hypothetical protein
VRSNIDGGAEQDDYAHDRTSDISVARAASF